MTDHRKFTPITCHYCPEKVEWEVEEQTDYGTETILVCNKHKHTAFS